MRPFDPLAARLTQAIRTLPPPRLRGRVLEVAGTVLRAALPQARLGELCELTTPGAGQVLEAEVIGFAGGAALLAPLSDMRGISTRTEVVATGRSPQVAVGPWLLGRVLDGLGRPMDGAPAGMAAAHYPMQAEAPAPLSRLRIARPLALGVRALDGLLTCGEGQRLGIFAAAGGGKSTLMGMLVHGAAADVVVIGLIGERGREVREFIESELGEQGRRRAVIVCATSDRPAMERVKAAQVATAIAEYFRDQGQQVLLLMDSVTRYARALRELGLAAGEPPTRRGYPPSVFAALPRLMERAGANQYGAITAFYTVLVEGDDMTEPVADETRSILDGHIILSRKLAAANHYPAIDVLASASRVMAALVTPEQRAAAGRVRELLAKYEEVQLLVQIGEYQRGSDAVADEAIDKITALRSFLRQATGEAAPFEQTLATLARLAR